MSFDLHIIDVYTTKINTHNIHKFKELKHLKSLV